MELASLLVAPGTDTRAKLPYVSGLLSRAVSDASRVSRARDEGEEGVDMTPRGDLWRADRASNAAAWKRTTNNECVLIGKSETGHPDEETECVPVAAASRVFSKVHEPSRVFASRNA